MLKYLTYLIRTFLLKKTSYIFLFLNVVFFLVFSLVQVITFNNRGLSYLDNYNTFDNFFLFILTITYSCLFCLHFFNDPQKDGTELLFSTSTLPRSKMVLSKFLAIIFFILFFQIVSLLFYWIPAIVDNQTNSFEKITYIFSLFVGGILVQFIFCSLISFFSLVLSKGATLTISIFIGALAPILSFFMAIAGNGNSLNFKEVNQPLFATKVNINSQEELENSQEKTSKESKYAHYYDENTTEIAEDYVNYKKNQWYEDFAFADLWNQFNGFYKVFTKPNYYDNNAIVNWEWFLDDRNYNENLINEIYVGDIIDQNGEVQKQYATLLTSKDILLKNNQSEEKYNFEKHIKQVAEQLEQIFKVDSTFKEEFQKENVIRRLLLVQDLIDNFDDYLKSWKEDSTSTPEGMEIYWNVLQSDPDYDKIATILKVRPISVLTYKYFLNNFEKTMEENIGEIDNLEDNEQIIIGNLAFLDFENNANLKPISNYKPVSFFPIYLSIALWITISSIFIGATVAIYLRKDLS